MALFNLTDIIYNKQTRGPLDALNQSKFGTNLTKYPIDLGDSYDKCHYMIIYINEQVNTKYYSSSGTNVSNPLPTVLQSRSGVSLGSEISDRVSSAFGQIGSVFDSFTSSIPNKVLGDNTRTVQETISNISNVAGGIAKQTLSNTIDAVKDGRITRKIRRTKDAIALYMPDTLNFTYNQSYSDFEIYNSLGNAGTLGTAALSLYDALKNGTPLGPSNVSPFLFQYLKDQGGLAGTLGTINLANLGVASNPGLELIYSSPQFREFRFEFMFYPRSEKEALQVKRIIDLLKFHQAPEIFGGGTSRFLVPPSEFDIKFYYNGKENVNIPRISTCVLTSIDSDYAPNGFAAYEIPGQTTPSEGGTGMPVGIRLSLQFKEVQILTKETMELPPNTFNSGESQTSNL